MESISKMSGAHIQCILCIQQNVHYASPYPMTKFLKEPTPQSGVHFNYVHTYAQ